MKIAISSNGNNLNSQIDPRFGRCVYFLIINIDNMSFEAFENESLSLGGGAGIQSAQFVASKGAKAVITGNCGPNAVQTLSAAGVELFVGQSGTVRNAIERYKDNKLSSTNKANVADHYGMSGGEPMPKPQGRFFGSSSGGTMGGGRDMGGGRGMRGGRGMGRNKER